MNTPAPAWTPMASSRAMTPAPMPRRRANAPRGSSRGRDHAHMAIPAANTATTTERHAGSRAPASWMSAAPVPATAPVHAMAHSFGGRGLGGWVSPRRIPTRGRTATAVSRGTKPNTGCHPKARTT